MMRRLFSAFSFSTVAALFSFWRGSLSRSGVLGALLVGTFTIGFGGWGWGLLLAFFFVSSSLLSHFKKREKEIAAEKFDKGHRRDLAQALANGGAGATAALLSYLLPSSLWFPFFLGTTATANADTWATELGTLSKRPPRLITNGRPAPVGTSGAISLLGTIVSFLGGALIGVAAGAGRSTGQPRRAILVGGLAGLAGSLFDSLLGATVQQIYYCDYCKKDTERKIHKCGHQTRPLRGWSWLNNDLVNLFASVVGGLTSVALWRLLDGTKKS
jgi:uncharacterized protein (TIGR00297 family)